MMINENLPDQSTEASLYTKTSLAEGETAIPFADSSNSQPHPSSASPEVHGTKGAKASEFSLKVDMKEKGDVPELIKHQSSATCASSRSRAGKKVIEAVPLIEEVGSEQ